MNDYIPELTSDEAWTFYKVLYRYEKEQKESRKHKGYDWGKVNPQLKESIKIDHSFNSGAVPETTENNTLNFKCKTVASDFLKHVRHAFAHNGISPDGNFYVITSYDKAKHCSMSGRVDKNLLEELINEVIASYNPNRPKRSSKRKKTS